MTFRPRLWTYALLLLFGGSAFFSSPAASQSAPSNTSPSAREPARPHPGVDVQDYDFGLTLSDDSDVITGVATVRVRFTADTLSVLRLDLIGPPPREPAPGMRVTSVTHDGRSVDVRHVRDVVRIALDPTPESGEERTFTVAYEGIPADGLVIGTNRHGARTFFGDNWPNRARHWLPIVDHPSDKATVAFSVTAPERYGVVANGVQVEQTTEGGVQTTRWETDEPLPTKVVVVGVADFAVDTVGTVREIPVTSWVYPQDREVGFEDLGQADRILRFFIEEIGEYPYEKLANVQSTTRYGGMENATTIFYSEEAVADGQDSETLLAHEIAHQWYGNSVTEADWPHLWLSEGFATYLTALWLEDEYGPDRLQAYMEDARPGVLRFQQQNPDTPLVDSTYSSPTELLTLNPYRKGAWVLHMLRDEVGTDAFWEGLRDYYRTYRDGNATTSDFRQVMESASGQDLTTFFDQWTRRAGYPILEGTWRYDAEAKECLVTWTQAQAGAAFDVSVDVAVESEGTVHEMRLTEREGTFRVDCSAEPSALTPDPNVRLLADLTLRRE